MQITRLPLSLLRFHPRLLVGILVGLATGTLIPLDGFAPRFLAGWNVGAWCYLLSTVWMMWRVSGQRMYNLSKAEDENAELVLLLAAAGAISSVATIVMTLSGAGALAQYPAVFRGAFATSTIVASWLLIAVLYTVHYARMFYTGNPNRRPLAFPDQPAAPDYRDFAYFAFTIAVALQTADVSIHSRAIRTTVIGQSLLAFLFNSAIVGLLVNVAAERLT